MAALPALPTSRDYEACREWAWVGDGQCDTRQQANEANRELGMPVATRVKEVEYSDQGYKPHPGQVLFHAATARFRVLACGRRWGKDRACLYELLRLLPWLLTRNKGSALVPTVLVWIVAPTYPLAEQIWGELKTFMPYHFIDDVRESDRCIKCVGGVEVWIRTASEPEKLVGAGLDLLVITEAALIQEEAWTTGLRPMLSSPGRAGLALINSTPKGLNWFHEIYLRGQDIQDKEVWSLNSPTWENPYISEGEVKQAKATLPEQVFRQEYGAEFMSDVGLVFRHVEGCVQGEMAEPVPGHNYIMGVDLAKHHDFTVVLVADTGTRRVVHHDRFSQIDYVLQKERIAQIARRYNDARGWMDSTGVGDPILEDLQRMGLHIEGYHLGAVSKRQLVDGLAVSLEQEQIRFPKIPQLISELKAYQYEETKAGNLRSSAPSGYWDDEVIALGLVVYGLSQSHGIMGGKPPVLIRRQW